MGALKLSYYREELEGNFFFSKQYAPEKLPVSVFSFVIGNHLGNVMEVISDRKIAHDNAGTIDYFEADIVSYSDYYPFGMMMPGRNGQISGGDYRYKFQGFEGDGAVSGNGNSYTTQFRQYDPRLGRWKSLDPLAGKYSDVTPYNGMMNNPIVFIDSEGDDVIFGTLPRNMRKTLIAELSTITGLVLSVKKGRLVIEGVNNKDPFSQAARDELRQLVENQKYQIEVNESAKERKNYRRWGTPEKHLPVDTHITYLNEAETGGGTENGDWEDKSGSWDVNLSKRLWEEDIELDPDWKEDEKLTFGLGFIFLHEAIGHVKKCLPDETDDSSGEGDYMIQDGTAADLINNYRADLGLPLRVNYVLQNANGTYSYVYFTSSNVANNLKTAQNRVKTIKDKVDAGKGKSHLEKNNRFLKHVKFKRRQNKGKKKTGKSGNPFILQ